MIATLEEVKAAIVGLSEEDRAELELYILEGANDGEDYTAEWLAVANERMQDVIAGKVVGIPAEEVMRKLLDIAK
jgi:hypothetical protein